MCPMIGRSDLDIALEEEALDLEDREAAEAERLHNLSLLVPR